MRAILVAVLLLLAHPSNAASPEVDAAVRVFRTVATNPAKLAIFCQLNRVLEEAGDQFDAATEETVQSLVSRIGPDFEAAWDLGAELEDDSANAATYDATVEALSSKCQPALTECGAACWPTYSAPVLAHRAAHVAGMCNVITLLFIPNRLKDIMIERDGVTLDCPVGSSATRNRQGATAIHP
jgi:hypothetical protein